MEKEDYGLTADELLNATDAELNQWVGLKRVTQWKGTKLTLNVGSATCFQKTGCETGFVSSKARQATRHGFEREILDSEAEQF